MDLLELYKAESNIPEWYEFYCSTGKDKGGKIFEFFNTNYRRLLSFQRGFIVLKAVEGVPRSDWERQPNHGQEIEKQHIRNMFCSKLFSKDENKYYESEKGKVFEVMLGENFTEEEKSFLIYLFILNGYFGNKINYIVDTVEKFKLRLNELKITQEAFNDIIKKFVLSNPTTSEMFDYEYTYIDSFFKKFGEIDFLVEYLKADELEKQRLREYVKENHQSKSYRCVLSYKFKNSGAYTESTLMDNAKILYVTSNLFSGTQCNSFAEFVKRAIEIYSDLFVIENPSKILEFVLNKYPNVFEIIYNNVMGIDVYAEDEEDEEDDWDITVNSDEKIDDTNAQNIEKSKHVSSVLKKISKQSSGYRCELEQLHNCIYFTSKKTLKNYLEVHHLIPREFANEYEKTIEIIENYVALCPSCHRLLHSAVDRERISALNYLMAKRKALLEQKGIIIDMKTMKEYYSIEE